MCPTYAAGVGIGRSTWPFVRSGRLHSALVNPRSRRAIVTGVLAALIILVLVGWVLGMAG
jgi:hypothetical protein